METNLTELLHLLSDEELIRLERRAVLAEREAIAEILAMEIKNRDEKEFHLNPAPYLPIKRAQHL